MAERLPNAVHNDIILPTAVLTRFVFVDADVLFVGCPCSLPGVFSVGAGVLFFREKVNAVNITGILLSLIGIVLVVMSKGELGKHFIFGIVLLLIAVLSEVGHASVTKSLSGNYSSQVIVMYQFLIGSVYLLPLFITKGLDNFSMRYLLAIF